MVLQLLAILHALSIDCPQTIQLAYNLGMKSKQPTIWNELQSDCCAASGVYCDSERVDQIYWGQHNLNGTINGTAIPSVLTMLYLGNNAITGPIPAKLPSSMIWLYLDNNLMTGDLPSFPSALTTLYLGYVDKPGNSFSGSLRMNQPYEVYVNYNLITDVVMQDISVFTFCDLSNNPLLGNPNIAGLAMCAKNGLYSAGLLPNTKSISKTAYTSVFKTITSNMVSKEVSIPFNTSTLTFTEIPTIIEISTRTTEMDSTEMQSISYELATTDITTSRLIAIVKNVKFVQQFREFTINVSMMIRVLISAMLLTFVFSKTPFGREFKRTMKKITNVKDTSTAEF